MTGAPPLVGKVADPACLAWPCPLQGTHTIDNGQPAPLTLGTHSPLQAVIFVAACETVLNPSGQGVQLGDALHVPDE